jgi:PPOX class probable F420-dependent enzyme
MTQPRAGFAPLQGAQFINLTTFRSNGQPVPTPVWFAQEADRLYVMTGAGSGKVKRIRNSGAVQVGPCDRRGRPTGPVLDGVARMLPSHEAQRIETLLNQKYGIMKRMIDLMQKLRPRARAYLEIVPRPDGDSRDRSA